MESCQNSGNASRAWIRKPPSAKPKTLQSAGGGRAEEEESVTTSSNPNTSSSGYEVSSSASITPKKQRQQASKQEPKYAQNQSYMKTRQSYNSSEFALDEESEDGHRSPFKI